MDLLVIKETDVLVHVEDVPMTKTLDVLAHIYDLLQILVLAIVEDGIVDNDTVDISIVVGGDNSLFDIVLVHRSKGVSKATAVAMLAAALERASGVALVLLLSTRSLGPISI